MKERSGEITREVTFTPPSDAARIDVFLPLTSGREAATRTVASVHYAVAPR